MMTNSYKKSNTRSTDLPTQKTLPEGDHIYYGYDLPLGPDFETDPYIKYNSKGKVIEVKGTPFQYKKILERIKAEKLFPFDKKKGGRKAVDYVKRNKLSRKRGYTFEDSIRKRVNAIDNEYRYHARRLGGSSTGLPDIVITFNDAMGAVVAMECKSGKDTYVLDIPADEIYRCLDTLKFLDMYSIKNICFAFKFAKSEKMKRKKVEERFWGFSRWDPYIEGERGNLMKVAFDIRKQTLTLWYADGGHRVLAGLRMNGMFSDFESFIDAIKNEATEFQSI